MIGPGLSEPQTGFSMVLQMASLFIPMSAETEIYYLCTTSNVYTYIYIYLHTFALHTYIVIPQKIEKSIPISQMTIHKHCHLFIAYCNYTCDRMSIPTRTINHYTWCRSYLIFTYMNIYIYIWMYICYVNNICIRYVDIAYGMHIMILIIWYTLG